MSRASRFTPYLYIAPLVALLLFVFGYPLVRIFEFSFKMVRGMGSYPKWCLVCGWELPQWEVSG